MAVPLLVSFLVIQINMFVDTAWCSGLGSDASSAVSTIVPIYWIISGVGTAVGVGASTAIARCLGRHDKAQANSLAAQTVIITLAISLASIPAIFVLIDPVISVIGASDIRDLCFWYILPIILMSVFIMMEGALAGIMRSEGAAKKAMSMLIVSACVNLVVDPFLIYTMDMGLEGAGWATGISAVASTALGLYWLFSRHTYLTPSLRGIRFRRSEVSDIMYVGFPKSVETILIASMSLIQRIFVVAVGGVLGAMLYNIPWRYVTLACVVSLAVSSALVPVCSAALGARDTAKAIDGYLYSVKLTAGIMACVAVVTFVFAEFLMMPFTYSPTMEELRPELVHVLRIYSLLIVFMGMIDIGSAILQSLRKAAISMWSAFVRNLFLIGLLYIASGISMDAVYWAVVITEAFGAFIMLYPAYIAARNYSRLNPPQRGDADGVRSVDNHRGGSRCVPPVRGQHPPHRVTGCPPGGEDPGDRMRFRSGIVALCQQWMPCGMRGYQSQGGGAHPQERGGQRIGCLCCGDGRLQQRGGGVRHHSVQPPLSAS